MNDFRILGLEGVLLGEGPFWDSSEKKVKYLDIIGKKLITVDLESEECSFKTLPEQTGCAVKTQSGKLVFGAESGVYDENFSLIAPLSKEKGVRFNDGKASPDGKFFLGTIELSGKGALFCLEKGKLTVCLDGVKISNGLDWSLDEKTMYYCDTATKKIISLSYPDLKPIKTVADFENEEGKPDGLCIDKNGDIWVALWGGGCVVRVNCESGEILERISFPAKYISCPSFVGENLDLLFVTSAKGDDESALAGRCFCLKTGAVGREIFKVNDENLRRGE